MNHLLAAAHARRSIRAYSPAPVPEEVLRDLLAAVARAPSAWNLQPWRFVVVREPELKRRLQAAALGQKQVADAPAVIVIYSDLEAALALAPRTPAAVANLAPPERESWGARQAGIALGYLLLLAEGLGLATSPMLGFDPPQVRELLGLPAHAPITALVAVGYPADSAAPSPRLDLDQLVRWR